jgi:hypothetical protein
MGKNRWAPRTALEREATQLHEVALGRLRVLRRGVVSRGKWRGLDMFDAEARPIAHEELLARTIDALRATVAALHSFGTTEVELALYVAGQLEGAAFCLSRRAPWPATADEAALERLSREAWQIKIAREDLALMFAQEHVARVDDAALLAALYACARGRGRRRAEDTGPTKDEAIDRVLSQLGLNTTIGSARRNQKRQRKK